MTPYQQRLSPTTRRMAEDMLVRTFSQRTIDAYTYHVDQFLTHCHRPAEQVTPDDIRSFQLHLVREKQAGWSSFNQAVCGLRFLYRLRSLAPGTSR